MENKRTTIYLGNDDRDAIAKIKQKYGVSTDSDAIRLALRLVSADEKREVVFGVRKNRKRQGKE